MLAVVQNDQQTPVAHVLDERLDHRSSRIFLHAEHGGDRFGDERIVAQRRELDEPYAVRMLVHRFGRDLQRQPRLAEPARTDEGQQSAAAKQPDDGAHLRFAADERCDLLRQVVRRRLERAQRREIAAQIGMQQLEHALRCGKIAQADRAEIAQRSAGRQTVARERDDSVRHEDLTAVRRGHQARRAIDGAAEIIAVTALGDTGVHAAAHTQRDACGRLRIGQRLLQPKRRDHRCGRIGERRMEAVAGRLDDRAAARADDAARGHIMTGKRRFHALGLALPQRAAAFNVAEQERCNSGRVDHIRSLGAALA